MRSFDHVRARTVEEAVQAFTARPGARYLAGGTDLVDLMRLGVERPTALIDISRLPLDRLQQLPDGSLRIGATVRNSDLAAHPLVRRRYPVLFQALIAGASGRLDDAATTGGNLLQRTRCTYFHDPGKPCNKREPGSGCGALDGVHRDHAVFGHSPHCIATHPSDMAVALAALDARVELYGPEGARTVDLTDLHRLPEDHPERDTDLRAGELVTGVVLPAATAGAPSAYRKVRDRASYAFALASVAVVLRVGDGLVTQVGLAFGALAHRPWRARVAEAALLGEAATPAVFASAVDLELAAARPLPDTAYKVPLARDLALDVLTRLAPAPAPF
ncbi:FAD binding domain-containing protein [Streptomyces sp. NPDC059629]|uniref:FAD binding domain-containing protein n=1 Tax=Streptomyces sp. NPDC059629 TaxID=3346889 RepID=UPI0036BA2B37